MAREGFTFRGAGKLARVDTYTSKAGKNIITLIFEEGGQYPQLIPIKVFGRLAEFATEWKVGDVLEVEGRLGGRDWNGKVYGDTIAQSVEVVHDRSAGQHREEHVRGQRSGWGEQQGKDADGDAIPGDDDDSQVPF